MGGSNEPVQFTNLLTPRTSVLLQQHATNLFFDGIIVVFETRFVNARCQCAHNSNDAVMKI